MYSRQEASRIRQEFWTSFGQYMLPVLSAEGERVNWINYKTGQKDITFRMAADNKLATIAIELTHKDGGLRLLYYEQLAQFRNILTQTMEEEWEWMAEAEDENGRRVSRVQKTQAGKNLFEKS